MRVVSFPVWLQREKCLLRMRSVEGETPWSGAEGRMGGDRGKHDPQLPAGLETHSAWLIGSLGPHPLKPLL